MEAIIAILVLILAAIIAKVVASHREFKDKEYLYIYEKSAINEDTTGDQNYMITVRRNKVKRKHQVTEKQVHTGEAIYYKNF